MKETQVISAVVANPEVASTKRLAWAFGCARKGSDDELQLYGLLRDRILRDAAARSAT